jgi:FkbM family methyltransferase
MIIKSFQNRFNVMKNQGRHIQYVLDIGAYRGDFTETIKSVWPSAIVTQIEADNRQKSFLQSNAIIALLGDCVQESVDFFTLSDDKITTGSSIFKESTQYYTDNTTIVLKKPMTTLDELFIKHRFAGKWDTLGLVKMDTQGSELLILDGAKNFLNDRRPKYILLETSIIEYNTGSPDISEYIVKMKQLGYRILDVFDLSYGEKNQLMQVDILWEKQ